MLGDISSVEHIYIACGHTDMRKSIDGLCFLVQQKFKMDPFEKSLFLFSGRKHDRLKALLFEGDGFVLLYKRLENGKFQWSDTPEEVLDLSRQQLRWLLEGLCINQPKAVKKITSKSCI
ncbi:IS66 family insertion sequence element accessory protein TnpB [Pectinatus cerevisiiphilus]|uniref:Transposase n=1 Tax=Pectinatus cerevisiiphilus TaxID=86956 RepID=A0A4V2UR75_9FIRM|nr:IS66 family insertion sequence element accessory protein TnpB [Pectinatus cerevisiiphilus]TCS74685.1 transposase [Pectinatus cerevisiiphilus]